MKSGSDCSRAGRMHVMLSGRLLLLLTSVLGRLVMGMRVRGTVRVTGTAVAVDTGVGAGIKRRQVGPLRRRRSKRGDVGERRTVRRCGNPAAGGVRREGRRSPVAEHRRVGHRRIVRPAAEQRPPSGFGRRRGRCASVKRASWTKSVRRRSQKAAACVHHR